MLVEDVATLVETASPFRRGVDLFLSRLPDTPDVAVAISQYGGRGPEFTGNSEGLAYDYPRIQVLSRSPDPVEAENNSQLIYQELPKYKNGPVILSLVPLQSPGLYGRDDNERTLYVFNIECQRRY